VDVAKRGPSNLVQNGVCYIQLVKKENFELEEPSQERRVSLRQDKETKTTYLGRRRLEITQKAGLLRSETFDNGASNYYVMLR